MKNYRIFVEKHPEFQVEAQCLRSEFNENLQLDLKALRLLNVYDLFGFTPELLEQCKYNVFAEIVTDKVYDELSLEGKKYIAIEFVPGQFDQRASSAEDCVKLINPEVDVKIKSSKLILLDKDVSDEEIEKIKSYYINTVEAREKDLSKLTYLEQPAVKEVPLLDGFIDMKPEEFEAYCKKAGLAMNEDDLAMVVEYFKAEGRNPNETELRILDTYWSDHCRHTTFTTNLISDASSEVEVEESFIKGDIDGTLNLYLKMRKDLGREAKPLCLMDMATIGARYLRAEGKLDDMEVSEEINACSIYIDVDVDGQLERYLLMFKNETHNHPTEIEPFGGAATCLGGAIRDPLSGRSYVYQAMRVTGAADICKPVSETIPGKLPQRIISKKAAHGYSSYGNQIGLATTHLREIYHEGYVAKRLEMGAVAGATKAENVRRETPCPGDIVIMFGGRTGRDGIGGATGSSKEHTEASLETCGSEVQKGNPPEERNIQRLFRRPEVTKLIKKSNDFGAGGVSVAIGELADGLDIYLDRVPVKYNGLNSTELAISESQERMSVVIAPEDKEIFMQYCDEENIEVIHVADVTDTHRMVMYNNGEKVVDLKREFIDSAGAPHYAKAKIGTVEKKNPFKRNVAGETLDEKIYSNLVDYNVACQKGMIEMFDSTIGRSTVIMPFGGLFQMSETQVSVQKIPVDGFTDTASMMAFGFNPYISEWSPYHGAAYAFVEACSKVVAAGGRYSDMRFSCQEFFERMTDDPKTWGKPTAALLGALKMQYELGLPSIGGKDSMSGTFENINVPPTLIAFGIAPVLASNVISTELEGDGNKLYLIRHTPKSNYMPDTEQLKKNWQYIQDEIEEGNIVSGYALTFGGVAEALCKMSFGNAFGVNVEVSEDDLFDYAYGSILVETDKELDFENAEYIGEVTSGEDGYMVINGVRLPIFDMMDAHLSRFEEIYPTKAEGASSKMFAEDAQVARDYDEDYAQVARDYDADPEFTRPTFEYPGERVEHPIVYIPIFPGSNCDYDSAKAFREAGAEVRTSVFRNLTPKDIFESVEEMAKNINDCHILMLVGGFSLGDEPDGSGKFIANVLNNKKIEEAVHKLLDRKGLILGICNGFQALVKSGLIPYGRLGKLTKDSPTLFRNNINRHISQMVTVRCSSVNSPWLSSMRVGDEFSIAVSHGEGKFMINEELANELRDNNQIAFQYIDPLSGEVTMQSPYNPNGSYYGIEGVLSPDGHILGKMGHTERYEDGLFKNIEGDLEQPIFENAVAYFRKEKVQIRYNLANTESEE